MSGFYKYIIIAFLIGGLVLVGLFLYQDYSFKNGMTDSDSGYTSQLNSDESVTQGSGEDLSVSTISVANTKETSYGLLEAIEDTKVVLNVDDTLTDFVYEGSNLILMCSNQELYEVDDLDLDMVSNSNSFAIAQLQAKIKKGDPVVLLSNNVDGTYITYAIIAKLPSTSCKSS